jgi:hypothetical protein
MHALTRRSLLAGFSAVALTSPLRSAEVQPVTADLTHLTPEQRARYEAMHARMIAALPYERVAVPGEQALVEWERLKAAGRGWPVIVGTDDDLERIADQFSLDDPTVQGAEVPGMDLRSPAEILAAAEHIAFPDDLRHWPGAYQPEDLDAPVGNWPSTLGTNPPGPSMATDPLSGRPHARVHILLIPARFSWEVPAWLRWGGWNACPPPEYHVAALRRWHGRHGAELIGMNGDTLNLRAARRPQTREEAMTLAREQYGYCPDIVDQGVESLSALAATLMASDWWYFWWD